jgi:Alcohol dehydrogenase GroES-like domain
MSRETTALVVRETGSPFQLETIRLDTLRADEALVQIHATGICHTDLSCAAGILPAHTPAVFGHEGERILQVPNLERTVALTKLTREFGQVPAWSSKPGVRSTK